VAALTSTAAELKQKNNKTATEPQIVGSKVRVNRTMPHTDHSQFWWYRSIFDRAG